MIPKKRDSSGTDGRLGHVGLGERAAAAQAVEHAGQLVGQGFEHGITPTAKAPLCEPSRSGGAPASGGDRVALCYPDAAAYGSGG